MSSAVGSTPHIMYRYHFHCRHMFHKRKQRYRSSTCIVRVILSHTLGTLGSRGVSGRRALPVMLWWMLSLSFSRCSVSPPDSRICTSTVFYG